MANLRAQIFSVQVFFSSSLLKPDPNIEESVLALTATSAVQQVMGSCGVSDAGVVYIKNADGDELWLHDVHLVSGQLSFSDPVERKNREEIQPTECRLCGHMMHQRCQRCGKAACYNCGRQGGAWGAGGSVYCEGCKSYERRLVGLRRSRHL